MEFHLLSFSTSLIQKQAVNEVMECNNYTKRFGLTLTEEQAKDLVKTRSHALNANGRIEFGGGVIDKIMKEFCDSPYLSMHNYEKTLHELVEIFYYYKNESMDLVSDDDLIKFMKTSFDGVCQGSLDLLSGRELYRMAKNLRMGYDMDDSADESQWEDEDE